MKVNMISKPLTKAPRRETTRSATISAWAILLTSQAGSPQKQVLQTRPRPRQIRSQYGVVSSFQGDAAGLELVFNKPPFSGGFSQLCNGVVMKQMNSYQLLHLQQLQQEENLTLGNFEKKCMFCDQLVSILSCDSHPCQRHVLLFRRHGECGWHGHWSLVTGCHSKKILSSQVKKNLKCMFRAQQSVDHHSVDWSAYEQWRWHGRTDQWAFQDWPLVSHWSPA